MLEAEMDAHLDTTRSTRTQQTATTGIPRNAVVTSELGDLMLTLPRDRHSEFDSLIVKKHQKRMFSIASQFLFDLWHEQIPDPTVVDAEINHILHRALRIVTRGNLMRTKEDPLQEDETSGK